MPDRPAAPSSCLRSARQLHSHAHVRLADSQGGCSVTMTVRAAEATGQHTIMQIRPEPFTIDRSIMQEAFRVHGDLVPQLIDENRFELAGYRYQILEMSFVPGVAWNEVQPRTESLDLPSIRILETLVGDLADVFAQSWLQARRSSVVDGRVGRSLHSRLCKLSHELPDDDLRVLARRTLLSFEHGGLDCLPVVLAHGDFIPSNILVDRSSGRLTGLVDWAEGEYLPFGMALYVLDYLVGYLHSDGQAVVYYAQASRLMAQFWQQVKRRVPMLSANHTMKSVMLARQVGIFLRHGFAWDDGRINRVVNAADDQEELTRLRAFLSTDLQEMRKAML